MEFVPYVWRNESEPCRFIPLTEAGETVNHFYRCGTQMELEEALARWLRNQISRIERQQAQRKEPSAAQEKEFTKLG